MLTDKIIHAVKTLWSVSSGAASIPQNRITLGRTENRSDLPYMQVQCDVVNTEYKTIGSNLVTYSLQAQIYSRGVQASGVLQRILQNIISGGAVYTSVVGANVLHVLSDKATLSIDPDTKLEEDIYVSNTSWIVLIQEDR